MIDMWSRSLLFGIERTESYSAFFLTNFMRILSIALNNNSMAAWDYLHRVPCVSTYRPRLLLRRPDEAYVVSDLLASMQIDDAQSLTRGILFLE